MRVRKVKIALIGISGFGQMHLQALNQMSEKGLIDFRAICEINYDSKIIYSTEEDEVLCQIKDIDSLMKKAFVKKEPLSGVGIKWVKPGKPFDVIGYKQFSMFMS